MAVVSCIAPCAFGVVFKGTVVDAAQAPVPGASLWVRQGQHLHQATSGADGAFAFNDLAVGPADVAAWKAGFAVGGFNGFIAGDFQAPVLLEACETLTIRVVDPLMKPLAGATLASLQVRDSLFVPVSDLAPAGFPELRSNDEGMLEIPMTPQGGFAQLVVSHYKCADSSVAYLPVNGKRQDVVLYPGLALRGRVTAGGEGQSDAVVTVSREGVGGQRVYAEVRTDPEGFYRARVPEGDYVVRVHHPKYASPIPQTVTLVPESEENVLDLSLVPPRHIEGSVIFPDGKPCVGVPVWFRMGEVVNAEAFTDADGAFSLMAGSPEGIVNITPPPGFMMEDLPDIPVNLGEKMTAKLSPIKLIELPVVSGITQNESGAPEANVLIASLDLSTPIWAISDAEGRFQIRLDYVPENRKASFRAEHALRFLRREFTMDMTKPKPAEVVLKPFEPDLAVRPAIEGRNDLHALEGKPAPELKCSDWFNAQPLTLESLKGKVTIVTFWGGFDDSVLGLGRIHEMRALYDLYRGVDDVMILAIHDAGSDADEVEEYVHRFGITFPAGRDADPFFSFVHYGVNFIPQTVILDKKGLVRFTEVEGRIPELIKTLRREN